MPTNPDLTEFQALTENEELRRQVSELQGKLRHAKAKSADLVEAVRQGSKDAVVALGNPPAVPTAKRDRRASTKAEVGLLHLSDWQFGKVTDSFNTEVAGR